MTRAPPRVSVVIPAYNAANTIAETLECVVAQTHSNLEVLVIDDGSTDGTADIISAFSARHPQVRLIRQANAGVAAARNAGLREADGDLVAPLDADDLWHPEKLGRQLARFIEGGSTAAMVYCWSTDVDETGAVLPHGLCAERAEGDVYARLVITNFIGNGSVPLIRRDLLEAIGGWDASLRDADAQGCEDWRLYLQLAERGEVLLSPFVLVGYRQRPDAMSRNLREMARSFEMVMNEARARHPEVPRALFRWSRGAFQMYLAEGWWRGGDKRGAAVAFVRSLALDPLWLARWSTRYKARLALRRLFGLSAHAGGADAFRPGRPFHAAPADLPTYGGDGRFVARRMERAGCVRVLERAAGVSDGRDRAMMMKGDG